MMHMCRQRNTSQVFTGVSSVLELEQTIYWGTEAAVGFIGYSQLDGAPHHWAHSSTLWSCVLSEILLHASLEGIYNSKTSHTNIGQI